jgi:hypothetical protein
VQAPNRPEKQQRILSVCVVALGMLPWEQW